MALRESRETTEGHLYKILPKHEYERLAYFEVVIHKVNEQKGFRTVVVTETSLYLLEMGSNRPGLPIPLTSITAIKKQNDRPTFLKDRVAMLSQHITITWNPGPITVSLYTFEEHSKVVFHLEHSWTAAKLRAVKYPKSLSLPERPSSPSPVSPSPSSPTHPGMLRGFLMDRPASPRRKSDKQMFEEMVEEVMAAPSVAERRDVLEEMATAVETHRSLKKLFFKNERLHKFLFDEISRHTEPPMKRRFKFSSDDRRGCLDSEVACEHLNYVVSLLDVFVGALSLSEGLPERMNVFNYRSPYAFTDLFASLSLFDSDAWRDTVERSKADSRTLERRTRSISLGSTPSENDFRHPVDEDQSGVDELTEWFDTLDDLQMSLVYEFCSLLEEAAVEEIVIPGETKPCGLELLISTLATYPSFLPVRVNAVMTMLTELLSERQPSADTSVRLFKCCKVLSCLASSRQDVRQYLMANFQEELQYLLNPNYSVALQSKKGGSSPSQKDSFFAEMSSTHLHTIVKLCRNKRP
eukprot:Rmarinus@m.4327